MSPETTDSKPSLVNPIARFGGGLAIGAFLVAIPLTYSSVTDLSSVQIGVVLTAILGCGLATGRWGGRFVDLVAGMFESSGF
jgi:prolipoprotein diacylglyceryltransferase